MMINFSLFPEIPVCLTVWKGTADLLGSAGLCAVPLDVVHIGSILLDEG